MNKTDPKKVPSQKFVFARTSRYNDPTFYEKKIYHFTIPLINLKKVFRRRKQELYQMEGFLKKF